MCWWNFDIVNLNRYMTNQNIIQAGFLSIYNMMYLIRSVDSSAEMMVGMKS